MRNALKKMAELTQGRESTRLPHTHELTSLKKKSFLDRKAPLPGPEMSRYPGCLLPRFAQDIKHFLSL